MSLDLIFFRGAKSIPVNDIDAYFLSLHTHAGSMSKRGVSIRRVALETAGLAQDFFDRLCENLDRMPNEISVPNAHDLRLGDWSSVDSLNRDLRTHTGIGLEDLFPTAAASPNELVLPNWESVERKLGEMRGKLAAPQKNSTDNYLSSLLSAANDLFQQVGFKLPEKLQDAAVTLSRFTSSEVHSENDELINAVDAMTGTIRHILHDPNSRYFLVWSN